MKHLFTLLFILLFTSNLFSQEVSVTVIETDGTPVALGADNSLNVLAGQEFYVTVSIIEPESNKSAFSSTAGFEKILFITPKNFMALYQSKIDYSAFETGATVSIDVSSSFYGPNKDFDGSLSDTISQYFTINPGGASRDSIIIDSLLINIPQNISTGDYVLQLGHNFISGLDSPYNLLTFRYQKPVIGVVKEAGKACYNAKVACKVSVTEPVGLEYALFIGEEIQKNGVDTIYVSSSNPFTGNFNNEDQITVRDLKYTKVNPTESTQISNSIAIEGDYFFKQLLVSMPYGSFCAGTPIQFTITNGNCYESKKVYFEDQEIIIGPSNTFTYNPTSNGYLVVKAFDNETQIATSNNLYVDSILQLENNFLLASDIKLSANQDPRDMFEELLINGSGSTFTFTDTTALTEFSNKEFYIEYLNDGSGDYRFGRFNFEYMLTDKSVYNLFDPSTEGLGQENEVSFQYGRYFSEASLFCSDLTSSSVVIDRNEIFIPKEKFCSYDSLKSYTIVIDTAKLPEIFVEGQYVNKKYKGYSISYLDDEHEDIIIPEYEFEVKPGKWWNGKDVTTVEIKAFADITLTDTANTCSPDWEPCELNESNYSDGDRVIYLGDLYECNVTHTIARPGQSSDWSFLYECHTIIEDPYLPGDPIKDPLLQIKKTTQFTETTLNSKEYIIGDIITHPGCIDKPTWSPTLQDVCYEVNDKVLHNGYEYTCIKDAYPNHEPGLYPTYWQNNGLCDGLGDTLSQFFTKYASAYMYIYKPKTNGTITNLDTINCPSKNSILLESNYSIKSVTGNGVIPYQLNNKDYYYYSFGKLYEKGYTNDEVVLTYIDDNGCNANDTLHTKIDIKYSVDTTAIIYWKNNNILNPLDQEFCLDS
ncbi:MAG TPA: hypothetical protein P5132_07940, partial [Bacteroidales bacterium]|nr:hypothetical protein [Bacteroidales bacterium]